MPSADQTVRVYRELAEDYGRQGQNQMRDRFLVLAADAALAAGQAEEAESLRSRLLQHNPHHLLKPYSSFAEAMKSTDVQNYVGTLRRTHPYEKAEKLLECRGAETGTSTRKEAPQARDDLKVFQVRDATEAPKAKPSPSGPHPRPALPSQQATSPVRPAGAAESLPAPRDPYPFLDRLRAARPEKEERDAYPGAWVATGLFVVLAVLGILLAAFTFLHPYLPQGWF
jgi:hypothetical protein